MRNAGGYAQTFSCDGNVSECDTFTCHHCNSVIHVPVKADPDKLGGMCRLCMKMVCPRCVVEGACTPFEERLAQMEASYHARRSYA